MPGYFAADGDAADTGAARGRVWRAHFVPDTAGAWQWRASFRRGRDVALRDDLGAGEPTGFDGQSGAFEVLPAPAGSSNPRDRGPLRYTGERYLRFAGSGEPFLKGGAGSPERDSKVSWADPVDGAWLDPGRFATGRLLSLPYSISGTVYNDVDADADVTDAGTLTVNNATVRLYVDDGDGVIDAGDTLWQTATTNASGQYTFSGLGNATYWIVVDSKTVGAAGYNASGFVGATAAD